MNDWRSLDRRKSPNRFFRNRDEGMLFGVCAGIADYFGVSVATVRVAAVFGMFIFFLPVVLAYLAASAFLPVKPSDMYGNPDEEQFWRAVRTDPSHTSHALRHRFRELDSRLQGVETIVTSKEFQLRRTIDEL